MSNNVYINRQEIVDYIKQNGLVYATTLETWPAADVREVVHGGWVNVVYTVVDTTANCGVCGNMAVWRTRGNPYEICPNCGADMRGNQQ